MNDQTIKLIVAVITATAAATATAIVSACKGFRETSQKH